MVVLVLAGITLSALLTFVGRQRRHVLTERLKADLESMAQISFFIIGRDIRRAGSNPHGWGTFLAGEPITFEEATHNRIIIRADLNGDGIISSGTDERVIYEYVDDPDNPDGIPDQIRRQSGDNLVITNVKSFEICYWMMGEYWDCNPADPAIIRKVRLRIEVGTGRINAKTGLEDTKTIQSIIRPRNFDI